MLPARKRQVRADPRGQPVFRVDYSSTGLLPPWQRDNQRRVERIMVHDPRSLANVWVLDETTDGYIAVPTRLPRPDMTLAQSEAARQALQACKARDHTEGRLFENLAQIRSIKVAAHSTTVRRKAERTRQASRGARENSGAVRAEVPASAHTQMEATTGPAWASSVVEPFADAERL